jgi:hypothetical protein
MLAPFPFAAKRLHGARAGAPALNRSETLAYIANLP